MLGQIFLLVVKTQLNPVFCWSVLEETVDLAKIYRKKYVHGLVWERTRAVRSNLDLVHDVPLVQHNTRSVANRSAHQG